MSIEKPVVVITGPQQKQLAELVSAAPAVVVVTNQEEYTAAASNLVVMAGNIKRIEALHADIAKPLTEALAGIKTSVGKLKDFFQVPIDRLKSSTAQHKVAMKAYVDEQEIKRAAAQKLLDDAAAAERKRIKDLADAAAEKARKEIAEQRKREADLIAKGQLEEAAKAAAKAEKAQATADVRADIAAAKIDSLVAPVSTLTKVTAAGVSTRKTWQYEITDANAIPRDYLCADVAAIRAAVKHGVRQIPGVRIYDSEDVVLSPRKTA